MSTQEKIGNEYILRRYWCEIDWGKDDKKFIKVILTHSKKATRSTSEKNRLHGF